MASHHHHHRDNHHHSNPNCCCCCGPCCSPSSSPPAQNAALTTTTDPLLQAIATHLLQSSPLSSSYLHQNLKSQHHRHHEQQQPQPQQQQQSQSLLIQSLLSRVAALETSLQHHLSSPTLPPKPSPPPRRHLSHPPPPPPPRSSSSIRNLAALTIQTHFRLHLVRRSQTLRHLKHLASIRSRTAALKSSLSSSDGLHHPMSLSQRATDLLLELDSIQSSDPMIREGKRSISRVLAQLLEFVEGFSQRMHELPLKSTEISRDNLDRRFSVERSPNPRAPTPNEEEDDEVEENVEHLKRQQASSSSRPVKRVSFKEKGDRSRVSDAIHEPFTDEEIARYSRSIGNRVSGGNGWASVEEMGDLAGVFEITANNGHREVVEEEEGGDGGRGGVFHHHTADEEKNYKDNGVKTGGFKWGVNGSSRSHNGHPVGLSAPLPVQMEPRGSDR